MAGVLRQLVGLVLQVHGDLLERVSVLAGVVGAEQQLATGLQLYAEVGLGTATVAAVLSSQGAGGNGGCHVRPHFSSVSVPVHNVARGHKIPVWFVADDTSIQSRFAYPEWGFPCGEPEL